MRALGEILSQRAGVEPLGTWAVCGGARRLRTWGESGFRRRHLDERPVPDRDKAELAGCEQGVDGFFHPGTRHKVTEEGFQFLLVGRNHAIEIFRNQRSKSGGHRKTNSFPYRL